MSILITGMEMPEFGEKVVVLTSSGYVEDLSGLVIKGVEAISVPPHGRLIAEADAIETAWMILKALGYRRVENHQLEQAVRETFATVPAIEVE